MGQESSCHLRFYCTTLGTSQIVFLVMVRFDFEDLSPELIKRNQFSSKSYDSKNQASFRLCWHREIVVELNMMKLSGGQSE